MSRGQDDAASMIAESMLSSESFKGSPASCRAWLSSGKNMMRSVALDGSAVAQRMLAKTLSEKSSNDSGTMTFCFLEGGLRDSGESTSEGTRRLLMFGPSWCVVGVWAPDLGPARVDEFENTEESAVALGVLDPELDGLSEGSEAWSVESTGLEDEDPSLARRRSRIWDTTQVVS